jgi:coenzyme F420 hydrogenase subunit beta
MSKQLEQEVWALDRCSGCGLCVATCSKGMLSWDDEAKHPVREVRQKTIGLTQIPLDTCSFCQTFCGETCPRLFEWQALPARRLVSAKTKGVMDSGEPSAVVKNLLIAALSARLIDGVIMSDVNGWNMEPKAKVMTTVGQVADVVGVQGLWVPVLDILNEAVYEKKLHKIAVVGPPCVSEAIRTLMASDNERLSPYKQAIELTIALFCTGVYYPELVYEFLQELSGIPRHDVRRLYVSPRDRELRILLWDDSVRKIALSKIERYTRPGCATCGDFLGESADIAVGNLGAKEGYCTVITRSEVGDLCLENALDFEVLEAIEEVDADALRRASEEKERRDRAEAFDELMLMMLDALREPQKRAEATQEFVRLYELDNVSAPVEEGQGHGGCARCAGC